MGNMDTFRLANCLLCSKQNFGSTTSSVAKNAEIGQRFCILAARHLHLDFDANNFTSMKHAKEITGMIRACDECAPVLDSFCQIYDLWEKLRLELNCKLEEIASKILLGGEGKRVKNEVEKLPIAKHSSDHVQNFRKELVFKVSKDKLGSFPYVKSEKEKLETQALNSAQNVSSTVEPETATIHQKDSDSEEDNLFIPILIKKPKTPSRISKTKLKEKSVLKNDSLKQTKVSAWLSTLPSPSKFASASTNRPGLHNRLSKMGSQGISLKRGRGRPRLHNRLSKMVSASEGKFLKRGRGRPRLKFTAYKLHWCPICHRTFGWNQNLQTHTRTHTKERPYFCNYCDKSFAALNSLNVHRRAHILKMHRPTKKLFRDRLGLQNHLKIAATEKPPEHNLRNKPCQKSCNLLGQRRNYVGRMPIHAKPKCSSSDNSTSTSTGNIEIPDRDTGFRFSCVMCNRRFSVKNSLDTHLRTHIREKPHSCRICPKSYSDHSNLNKHKMSHCASGMFPFRFQTCDKCFRLKSHLNQHLRFHKKKGILQETLHARTLEKIYPASFDLDDLLRPAPANTDAPELPELCQTAEEHANEKHLEIKIENNGSGEVEDKSGFYGTTQTVTTGNPLAQEYNDDEIQTIQYNFPAPEEKLADPGVANCNISVKLPLPHFQANFIDEELD